jgi:DNA-binding transcriptional MocR family regulator
MTIWSPDLAKYSGSKSQAIVDALSDDLEQGVIAPGTRLPTHRELADKLGIATGTVTRAYALAQRRGLVSGEIGRGTFVAPATTAGNTPAATTGAQSAFIDLSNNRIVRDARDLVLSETLATLGDPHHLAQLLDYYQPAAGNARHREVGAAWLSTEEFQARPEQTLICSGAQHAMSVALSTLTAPGDTIMCEYMIYPGMVALASLLHISLHGLPMDDEGIQPDAFEAACRAGVSKVLYCIPTLQNPTAAIMSDARRLEIVRIARRYDVTIIEDDVYGFLVPDAPPPLIKYAPERCYYINSTSKSIAPGLRIGYIVAPPEAVEKIGTTIRTTTWEAAPLMAEVATKWIEDGTATRIINWKRREMGARQLLAKNIFGHSYSGSPPMSCHLWLHLPEPWRSEHFISQARAQGVGLTPSNAFAVGRGPTPHAVRICLGASHSQSELEKGLRILTEILQDTPEPALTVT